MSGTLILLQLGGYVGLLLWGTHMVTTGVERGFGGGLRLWLGRSLARPGGRARFYAFLAGLAVTAVLQSSTATGLMATSFAARGALDLTPALAVHARGEPRQHLDHPNLGLRHHCGGSAPCADRGRVVPL